MSAAGQGGEQFAGRAGLSLHDACNVAADALIDVAGGLKVGWGHSKVSGLHIFARLLRARGGYSMGFWFCNGLMTSEWLRVEGRTGSGFRVPGCWRHPLRG